MRKKAVIFIFLFCLISTLIVVPQATASSGDDWPMFHHDAAHTGYSASTGPLTNQTLWTFTTGGTIGTSPAVVDGKVYFGSDDGSIYAVNAYNGAMIWNFTTEGPAQSSPAVVDGIVYAGGYRSHMVFAINATTGNLVWKTPINSSYPNSISATAVANGAVYVTVYIAERMGGGALYALNITNGDLLWKNDPGGWLSSSPAVAGNMVYIGISTGQVLCFDAATGQKIWIYRTIGDLVSNASGGTGYYVTDSLTVANGLVYVGLNPEVVLALNASNGAFVWKGSIVGGVYQSCPAVANGKLYICTSYGGYSDAVHAGGVCALNATTGKSIWNQTIGSISQSSPAVTNDFVYVGSDEKGSAISNLTHSYDLYALNASSGEIMWTYTTGGIINSSPAVANGIVYVGSNDGKVYAIGEGPSSSPAPTASSTQTPSTSQSSTSPPYPSTTQLASPTLTPSPSVSELPQWTIFVLVAASVAIIVYKRGRKKSE